jgi:hypothetical protein
LWAIHGSRHFQLRFQFRAELDDRRGLLDGVEHFAGSAMIELAGAQGVRDLRQCDLHRGEVVQRREVETVRHVIAQGAGAAQAASASNEVMTAVFAVL